MKKILSLTLAVILLVSAIPTAFAADQDYSLGTAVTVEGSGGEYTVTVPATLTVNQTGTVTAKGYWAAENTLKVTAPETIEVTNTETSQKATVNVTFAGIESLGDDLEELTKTAPISIDAGNTKFGVWTGTIVYTVELVEPPAPTLITFTIDGTEYQAEEGMTWKKWSATDYNPSTSGISKPIPGVTVYKTEGSYKLTQSGGAQLSSDDVIIAGHSYEWSSI